MSELKVTTPPCAPAADAASKGSYGRMLRATSVVAGSRLVTIGVSFLRLKAVAFFLGPAGFGLVSLVSTAIELFRVVFGLGLDGATVKLVAQANSESDDQAVGRAYATSTRLAMMVGGISWLVFCVASPWLSLGAFGDISKAWLYVLGGTILLFAPLLGVQLAFIQGLRRVRLLAACQIISSLLVAAVAVALVYFGGSSGAVISLAAGSLVTLLVHLRMVAPYRGKPEKADWKVFRGEVRSILKSGSGFAINGLWLTASAWLNLLFLRHYYGEGATHEVGLFSAANMLSTFCFGIVFSSMATEFYPALTAAGKDLRAVNKLLNQQTLLSVAIGVTGSLVAVVAAPLLLVVAYSRDFVEGAPLMRLLLLAMSIRFAACPLGFSLLARGHARIFAACEIVMGFLVIGSSYAFLKVFGVLGLGMALILSNTLQFAGLLFVNYREGIRLEFKTLALLGQTLASAVLIMLALSYLPVFPGYAAASAVVCGYGCMMLNLIGKEAEFDWRAKLSGFFSKAAPKP